MPNTSPLLTVQGPSRAPFLPVLLAVALSAALAAGCSQGGSPAAPSPVDAASGESAPPLALIDQVAAGGYVVFFRHAARDASALPTAEVALADNAGECRPGSELTPAGAADAEAIGRSFVRHGIRVQHVYVSPACRAVQMAALAFGTFDTTRALSWLGMWGEDEGPALAPALRRLLGTPPFRGRTIVLISHNDVLKADRVGIEVTLDQSSAAVFRPLGGEAFELVGKISREEWLR